jgi:hypothetical protein
MYFGHYVIVSYRDEWTRDFAAGKRVKAFSGFEMFARLKLDRRKMLRRSEILPRCQATASKHSWGTVKDSPVPYSSSRHHSTSGSPLTQELHTMHFEFYRVLSDTRATNSSNLESKSLRMGDGFDFLWPRTRSIVGVSPLRGRLVTDRGRKFCA